MREILYSKIVGEGIPFIVIHGYLGMSDNWKTFGGQISELGYEVHLLDMRNHGRSFHSDAFDYEVMTEDLRFYMEAKKIESAIILGHSMGGKVAMSFAVAYPEKVQKLIVADISPRHYAPHHQDIMQGLNAVDFSKKPSRAEVDEILEQYVPDVGTRMFLMKSLYWKEPGQLAFRFNLEVFNRKEDVIGEELKDDARFEGEVLFVKGAKSGYIQEKDEELIYKYFPKAKVEAIANAGHWLHAENPADFFERVKVFIKT